MCRLIKPERPPVYEFSIRNLFLLHSAGLLYTCLLIIWFCISHSLNPLFLLLLTQFFFFLAFLLIIHNSMNRDIPAECYHPELLPHKEYLDISRRYRDARDGIYRIKTFVGLYEMAEEDKNILLKEYQEIVDNVSPILRVQNNLRGLCLLKKIFGDIETPAIYGKRPRDSRLFQTALNDEKDDITDSNDISELQAPQSFEISLTEYENVFPNNASLNSEEFHEIMTKFENFKIQFAEMKAENETLKESMEQILESQIVF